MVAKITNVPTRVDLFVYQGSSFGPCKHTLRNPDGTRLDLTGCSFTGQVRHDTAAATVAATFDIAIDGPPEDGVYAFELSYESTAAIPAGKPGQVTPYVFDIFLHDTLGRSLPTLAGSLQLTPRVTRP